MKVILVDKSSDYLKKIWLAARSCYSSLSAIELLEQNPTQEEMLRIADKVISSKHLSVLEHCHMTFAVKDVSRTLLAQYTRHRIGISLSVQSQRYVSEASDKQKGNIFDYVIPPEIKGNEEAKEVFLEAMGLCQQYYDKLKVLGIKNQDARFVLPGGAGTNFLTSLNLRSLFDVYEKRVVVPGAQWEIKEMVLTMVKLIVDEEPWLKGYFYRIEF
ncbi:MAG: FAD-dependent thymidylate synthase [Bacillota bacterium]